MWLEENDRWKWWAAFQAFFQTPRGRLECRKYVYSSVAQSLQHDYSSTSDISRKRKKTFQKLTAAQLRLAEQLSFPSQTGLNRKLLYPQRQAYRDILRKSFKHRSDFEIWKYGCDPSLFISAAAKPTQLALLGHGDERVKLKKTFHGLSKVKISYTVESICHIFLWLSHHNHYSLLSLQFNR